MKFTATLLALASLTACDPKEEDTADVRVDDSGIVDTGDTGETMGEVVTIVVDNHQLLCSGEGQWICPQVQIEGSDWQALGCGVDGLEYVWGTTYSVTATKTGFSDPAGDGCGDVYDLVEVQDSTFDGAGREFSYTWVYDVSITGDGAGGGELIGVPFVCGDAAVCELVETIAPKWQTLYHLTLRNPDKPGEPLVMVSIEVAH